MAAPGISGQLLLLLLSVTITSLLTSSSGQETPTLEIVAEWGTNVYNKFLGMNLVFANVNGIYQRKCRDEIIPQGLNFRYEDLKEMDLVKEMAESLSILLGKHVRALEKSVEAAEKIAAAYKWNNNLLKDDVSYMNNKELKEKNINLVYNEQFEKEVNLNFSSVHIPVEIYDGNIDILNGLNWTAGLDEQFKLNHEEDPEILWQYFGSQTGFLRTFPAALWPYKGVDLYDVRRRSWYTQGSSSPKDMMIMIDTSGSTHGQSLQLMQNAVKSILDTLGENDYVNIVAFAEQAHFVSKCFNHTAFVQANYRNKQRLMKDLDNLTASGQADFTEAIKFAFGKFKEFNNNDTDTINIGANCNKVIMLLTDGSTDDAKDVFENENWPNKTVRVFTYAVGATPNPVKALRWMACANRGYFSQIPAMGAIRARVQEYTRHLMKQWEYAHAKNVTWEITYDPREYIPVLSRPQVIMDEKVSEWGNIYEDHLELGMMTTVTRPVYNYSRDSSNQTILGVMAIDVTTAQLEAKTPFSKIGPNGYSFAINPNGYVVFHPNLYTSGKFLTEPPNIDLLELEVEQDNEKLQQLRSDMIDGINGTKRITTYFLSPDQRYIAQTEADYAYVSITNTSFRLGLCVPAYQIKYPKFNGNITQFDWSIANSNAFKVLIAPWEYHKGMKRMKNLKGTLDDVTDLLKKDPDPKNWNLDLLYHLYWDVSHIEEQLIQFLGICDTPNESESFFSISDDDSNATNTPDESESFFSISDDDSNATNTPDESESFFSISDDDSNATNTPDESESFFSISDDEQSMRTFFIMTNGGMTLVSPPSEAGYFESERDLRKSSIFKRALLSKGTIFMADYTEQVRSNYSATPYIIAARGLFTVEDNTQNSSYTIDTPGVSGEKLRHEDIIAVVLNASKTNQKYKTCEDSSIYCYLVDDGGFLVATSRSNYREQIGRFFGLVDPPAFNYIEEVFFQIAVQYDFQATCLKENNTKSAGFKNLHVPTMNMLFELLNVGWWSNKIYWAFSSFNIFSWFNSENTFVYANDEEDNEKKCVKATYQYYVASALNYSSGNITCLNCTRIINVVRINSTNLLFIVVDKRCEECDSIFTPVSQAPAEVNKVQEEEIVCDMAKNLRKRVRDYECHHSHPLEDSRECGCSSLRVSCLSLMLVFISVALRWMSDMR